MDRVKIEIKGKDAFWAKAFHIEWEDQFPDLKLQPVADHFYFAEREWMAALQKVATQCQCRVLIAPDNLDRRSWLRTLIGGGSKG